MIIGISGKKQHGKDTVAKIIQYLMIDKDQTITIKNWLSHYESREKSNALLEFIWERKQFAHKLKQIVCLLIGCTLEQLEDNTFKETPLGEEWRVWHITREEIKLPTHYYGLFTTENEIKEFIKTNKMRVAQYNSELLTPRKLLQVIGTDAGRNLVHPNIWVNALMSDYTQTKITKGFFAGPQYPNWIITDVRFPNEVKAIESRGGIVIRVNRPNPHQTCQCGAWWFLGSQDSGKERCPKCGTFNYASVLHIEDTHYSETALDDWKFEYMVTNNGTLEELVKQVENILKLIPHASIHEAREEAPEGGS